MGKFYFVRHGQTDRNAKKMMNPGDVDSELNEVGIQQAIDAGKKAKTDGIKFDIIISSPLVRALDTAKHIAQETGFTGEILTDKRLEEQYAGVFKDYSHAQFAEEYQAVSEEELRRIFKSKQYNKIEDISEFADRVTEFYNEVKEKYSGLNVLMVGHSGTSRIILMNSEKLDFEEAIYKIPSAPNATIIELSQ